MVNRQPIRVIVVDDHDMIRIGLTLVLESFEDLQLVGEAADGREALRVVAETEPDVILMDLVMPHMNGTEAIRLIHTSHPKIRIIILTSFGNRHLVDEALEAGAGGYLLKNASIYELARTIRATMGRGPVFNAI